MTPEREAHLLSVIASSKCVGELDGMRVQIKHQGELTTEILAAIRDRMAELNGASQR